MQSVSAAAAHRAYHLYRLERSTAHRMPRAGSGDDRDGCSWRHLPIAMLMRSCLIVVVWSSTGCAIPPSSARASPTCSASHVGGVSPMNPAPSPELARSFCLALKGRRLNRKIAGTISGRIRHRQGDDACLRHLVAAPVRTRHPAPGWGRANRRWTLSPGRSPRDTRSPPATAHYLVVRIR
jgi:hypothetical protein